MNDEQMFRIASIKALSVDLLTAAHDMSEGRLISVMAELSELFRVVRMDHDTRHRDDAPFEPKPTVARSSDALKDLVEAEFMRQVGISHHVPVGPEEFGLENPPVVTEPEPSYDMSPVQPWVEYEDGEEDEDAQDYVEPELKMSAMYDATTKWV